MKKFLSLALAAVLLLGTVSLLGGCSQSSGSSAPSGSSDGQTSGQDVVLSFVRNGSDQAETDYWLSLIEIFEEDHPGIKVQYDDAAIGESLDTKLNTQFASGAGPDLIGNGILSVANRVEMGHYQPITSYFNSWEGKDDLMESVLANGSYKDEVYGLAYSTTPYLFAYRKDYFEQAGLDPESPPANWDQLKEYALKLTVKDGDQITRAGFAFPMSAGNFVEYDIFVFGNGGMFYDDAGNPTLDTPEKAEAFEFLMSFLDEVNLPYNSNEVNPFLNGNAAMTLINNVTLTPMLKDEAYKDKVGIAFPPYNTTKANFSGCNMLFVGRDCQNVDAAFSFIAATLSKDEVLRRAEELFIPVVRSSLVDEYAAMDPMNAVRAECVEYGIGMPLTTWSTLFQKVRNNMVQEVIYSKSSPQQALTDAQKELENEIAAQS